MNVTGLRRAGLGVEEIGQIKEAYRVLFASGVKLQDALATLDMLGSDGNSRGAELAVFVRKSERGIARPNRRGHERPDD